MWKQTKKKPPQLEGPEMPEELRYIWNWFDQIFTGEQLNYQELAAWAQLQGYKLTPDEVTLIRHLDQVYWRTQHEGVNKR